MTVSDIIEKVKVKIDEIASNDSESLLSQDNSEMETIIRNCITDAARFVIQNCGDEYLKPTIISSVGSTTSIDVNLVGHIKLPANFLRFLFAKISTWKKYVGVEELILWNDPRYATLSDQYATGTYERPKVALILAPEKELELYSARHETDTITVGIVTEPSIKDGSIDIPEKLETSFVYHVAGLTLLTYKDSHADDMFNQALLFMGKSTTKTE